jgi:hypothetical protein
MAADTRRTIEGAWSVGGHVTSQAGCDTLSADVSADRLTMTSLLARASANDPSDVIQWRPCQLLSVLQPCYRGNPVVSLAIII